MDCKYGCGNKVLGPNAVCEACEVGLRVQAAAEGEIGKLRAENDCLRAEVAREREATDISRSLADALREDNVRLRVERTAAMNERDALRAENERLHQAMDARRFPIMVEMLRHPDPSPVRSVPWALAERAYMAYAVRYGTDQSMERLAQRGGFSAREMDVFAPGWRNEVRALQVLQGEVDQLRAAWAWLAKHPGWYVQWGAGSWQGQKYVGWYVERPGENTRETLVELRQPSPLEAVIAAMEHEAAQAAKDKADA